MDGLYTRNIRSTLIIGVKDGAARITIADPYFNTTSGFGVGPGVGPYYPLQSLSLFQENCMPKYLELIASLKKALEDTGGTF